MSLTLSQSYFQHRDVVYLAKDLIGKKITTCIDGKTTSGIITETEAYAGRGDKACHAHLGRFTERTKVMYKPGGIAYVYLCYGIHHLFNIVTNTRRNADAILIRAVEPLEGIDTMRKRRGKEKLDKTLTSGPGNFTKAFGISKTHNEMSVISKELNIEHISYKPKSLVETKRIGIDYADEDVDLPWRFYDNLSKFVSKK